MKRLATFLLAAMVSLPILTRAHEGHGHEHPWTPGHFLANPEHAIPLALAIGLVTAFIVRSYFIARKARK